MIQQTQNYAYDEYYRFQLYYLFVTVKQTDCPAIEFHAQIYYRKSYKHKKSRKRISMFPTAIHHNSKTTISMINTALQTLAASDFDLFRLIFNIL